MAEFFRRPTHRYQDPLARVWISAAEHIGFRVERTTEAFASTDGRGTLLIGTDDMLDPDDCLAQMIFHELCHALVEGEEGERKQDWGLGYAIGGNPWREHACLRLQAYLAGQLGLREFFAPTTDFRVSFWNALGEDPFEASPEKGGRRERSCVAARLAAWRASRQRWAPLLQALQATAAIASALSIMPRAAEGMKRTAGEEMPSLWTQVAAPPPPHPAGHSPIAPHHQGKACADCAWSFEGRSGMRCRHAPRLRLAADMPACWRFEPGLELDCLTCGACCREAYQAVEISSREPVNKRHPELVLQCDSHRKLRREGERCAALAGGRAPDEAYACTIYADRPRTCREFTRGSENCLDARRRVGLSL